MTPSAASLPAASLPAGRFAQAAARPRDPKALAPWAALFWRHPNPWVLTAWLGAALALRATQGPPTWGEVAAAGFFLAIRPPAEWLIHTYILHFKPVRVGRLTLDHAAASEHRRHHEDPHNLPLCFIPPSVLAFTVLAISGLVALFAINAAHGATVLAVIAAQFLAYEWVHFLVHAPYRPRGRAFRALWQHHRLHHHRNERYWMGVTTTLADRWLGTAPGPREVEISPTARALLGAGEPDQGQDSATGPRSGP